METGILRDLGLIIVAALAVTLAARALRIPAIVAYMLAGLLLGPATDLVHPSHSLELVSELGIALLLFLVGLELSVARMKDIGRVALISAIALLTLTCAGSWLVAYALGARGMVAALIALGASFSSTVVVIKLFEQRGELRALHGRIAVGVLLIEDVAVAVVLTLLAGLEGSGELGLASVGRGVLRATVGMLALVAIAFVAVRWVLPRVFGWLAGSLEAIFIGSLTWCFGFILAAQALGLSVELGAFVAGVGLAQLAFSEEMVRRIHPLANFFLAIFFVTLGIHFEVAAALAAWPWVVALSAFILIAKPTILLAVLARQGLPTRAGFLAAVSLSQLSEFSLILAAFALDAGLVGDEFISIMGAIALVTIGLSAAMIQGGDRLHDIVRDRGVLRLFGFRDVPEPTGAARRKGHIVVIGMNSLGRRIVRDFAALGETVLAVDVDEAKLRDLPAATLQGTTEHVAVMDAADAADAKLIVSALQIEEANAMLAHRARELGVPSSIHAFEPGMIDDLRAYGATHLMVSKYDGIRRVAAELRRCGVIG